MNTNDENKNPKTDPKLRPTDEGESSELSSANYWQKAEEYLDSWKRERADFLNYKKDESKRLEEMIKYANEDVILEVLEVVDDLELAAKEVPGVGLEQIIKKFTDLFKKYGVERIAVDGKMFDPTIHEAVETQAGGEKIVEVRAGYKMRDKVIRPSRVKITK